MTHLGLFEGIGGFSLAAKWMGWHTKAWCEINPFGQQVLKYHFPEAEPFTDITKSDFTKYANRIDILTGGFPCQPYSAAGKRKGTEDERHLWPEMLRAIGEIQPRWIVGENVPGLINWSRGMVLEQIKTDLEDKGFEVFPPIVIPACAKGAPHRRERLWIIAYTGGKSRSQSIFTKDNGEETQRGREASIGLSDREFNKMAPNISTVSSEWLDISKSSLINDGFPSGLDEQAISEENWVRESGRGAGNAIVPQVAFEIFKSIKAFETLKTTAT